MTLIDLLRQRPPETPALVEAGNTLTISALLAQSERLAAGLQALGVRPGDTAVLATQPNAGFVKIVYAALLCGLRLAIIDPGMGRDNYREKLRQLQPQWAFVDSRLLLLQEHPVLRSLYFRLSKNGMYFPATPGLHMISTGPWMPLFQQHTPLRRLEEYAPPISRAVVPLPPEAAFMITYTSGTTGVPKGVVHTAGALQDSISQISALLGGGHNQRLATHLPHFVLIGLNAGVEVYLWKYADSPTEKLQFIRKHQITTLFSPPCDYLPLIEYCAQNDCLLPDCLQHLFFGSAPVYRSFLERLLPVLPEHVRLTCLYGMTENLVVATIDGREKAAYPTSTGDILGRPVPGVELRIAPDGEILVRSPQLFERYLHLAGRDAWHASGDLGYIAPDGRLVLTGRKKDMIIRRNFNLYPGLYEPTINRISGVTECAFIGVYDEKKQDECVVLFVETYAPLTEPALRRALESGACSIDQEAWPDYIYFEKLPRSGRQSKVDKATLRKRFSEKPEVFQVSSPV
ncbi:MAG: long-chain fatty acid--CoA ligase [Bacteroidetes bacterium]|nr:MAG: long-chain fatty acid--CoA ligase [Bacteroidota bacterium]